MGKVTKHRIGRGLGVGKGQTPLVEASLYDVPSRSRDDLAEPRIEAQARHHLDFDRRSSMPTRKWVCTARPLVRHIMDGQQERVHHAPTVPRRIDEARDARKRS